MHLNDARREPAGVGFLLVVFGLLILGCCFSVVAEEPAATEAVVLLDVQNMT